MVFNLQKQRCKMSTKGATKKGPSYITVKDLRPAHQRPVQGLADALFAMDEDVTQWSPEKPPKPAVPSARFDQMSEQRSNAQDNAINAIITARYTTNADMAATTTQTTADSKTNKPVARKLFR